MSWADFSPEAPRARRIVSGGIPWVGLISGTLALASLVMLSFPELREALSLSGLAAMVAAVVVLTAIAARDLHKT
jgi:hypothetical protein